MDVGDREEEGGEDLEVVDVVVGAAEAFRLDFGCQGSGDTDGLHIIRTAMAVSLSNLVSICCCVSISTAHMITRR